MKIWTNGLITALIVALLVTVDYWFAWILLLRQRKPGYKNTLEVVSLTRMTTEKEQRREYVENALSVISTAGMLLELQVRLRINQAMSRDGRMVGLLGPSLHVLDRADHAIGLAKDALAAIWHAGESQRWDGPAFSFPIRDKNSSS